MRRALGLTRAVLVALVALVGAAALVACGKKGPPLPPLPGMKPAADDLVAWQVGNEVHATFSLPVRPGFEEVDYSVLAIELWRRPLERALDLEDSDSAPATAAPDEETPREFRGAASLAVAIEGEDVFDWLTAAKPVIVDPLPAELLTGGPLEYGVVLKTSAAKRGTLSNLVALDPWPPPQPPSELVAEPLETGIRLAFTPPPPQRPAPAATTPPEAEEPDEPTGDEGGDAPDEATPDGADGAEAPAEEAGPTEPRALPMRYEVYRAEGERAFGAEPLDEPFSDAAYVDAEVVPGRRYRYFVRAIVEREGDEVRSGRSQEVVVDYRDLFAPAPPDGLRAILEGRRAVALIWNPSQAADLGGYRIYRREPGGEWTRIDSGERKTATFTDRRVAPGTTYEYAVTAHDTAAPPNESERSSPARITVPAAP